MQYSKVRMRSNANNFTIFIQDQFKNRPKTNTKTSVKMEKIEVKIEIKNSPI
jgi:hypothetical protein